MTDILSAAHQRWEANRATKGPSPAKTAPMSPAEAAEWWSDRMVANLPSHACAHRGQEIRRVPCGCGDPPIIFRCNAPANERHECSLVKICGKAATAEPNVPACKNCPWRELPEAVKPQPNPGVPRFERVIDPLTVRIKPKWLHLIDDSRLPRSDHHINGGVIRFREKLYLVYRLHWGGGEVHLAELDHNLSPIRNVKVPIKRRFLRNQLGDEDPRPFIHNNALWVTSCGFNRGSSGMETNIHYGEIGTAGSEVKSYWPKYPRRRPWEKNWQPFIHGGVLHAVYQSEPAHVVLRLEENKAIDVAEVPFKGISGVGLLRGGACPVLHNGEYYSFVHGVYQAQHPYERATVKQFYTAALYTFSAKPPFQPLRILPFPLLVANGKSNCGGDGRAIFPCGAFYENRQWVVSGGWHDKKLFVAAYDAEEIERALVAVC